MAGDQEFLRHLFISNRWHLFASLAASDDARLKLLSSQFDLQDLHYRTYFAAADRRIVLVQGKAVGRLYLMRGDPMWTLVDLSLLPEMTGHGTGSRLIDLMLEEADAARRPISLHCSVMNPVFELYKAKGFVEVREENGDWVMERWPEGRVS